MARLGKSQRVSSSNSLGINWAKVPADGREPFTFARIFFAARRALAVAAGRGRHEPPHRLTVASGVHLLTLLTQGRGYFGTGNPFMHTTVRSASSGFA